MNRFLYRSEESLNPIGSSWLTCSPNYGILLYPHHLMEVRVQLTLSHSAGIMANTSLSLRLHFLWQQFFTYSSAN